MCACNFDSLGFSWVWRTCIFQNHSPFKWGITQKHYRICFAELFCPPSFSLPQVLPGKGMILHKGRQDLSVVCLSVLGLARVQLLYLSPIYINHCIRWHFIYWKNCLKFTTCHTNIRNYCIKGFNSRHLDHTNHWIFNWKILCLLYTALYWYSQRRKFPIITGHQSLN